MDSREYREVRSCYDLSDNLNGHDSDNPHSEDDSAFVLPVVGDVVPKVSKDLVAGATLTDDLGVIVFQTTNLYHSDKMHLAVIPCVVVNVDFIVCTGTQTCIDEHVVVGKLSFVEHTSHLAVREILPTDGEAEHVVTVILDKMLHLTKTIGT